MRRSRRGSKGILAVMFTKKSAGEMERRLAEVLSSAVVGRGGPPPRRICAGGGGRLCCTKIDY